MVALAVLNSATPYSIRLIYPKGEIQPSANLIHESWSIHGQVMARQAVVAAPFYWGPGIGADGYEVERIEMVIDGAAGTSMTRWDGELDSLAWVQHDVTSLPYHLRRGGDAGVIGVGGGRDLLTALWGESRSVVGIEINYAFIELLEGPLCEFANLTSQPQVSLVHDEARSYLTRTDKRFDVLQMSLIDTWAATGAGAFTLSENGLYTVEAWDVFLNTLRPRGIFSVSRWYAPDKASETSRLVALATAALLRNGVEDPAQNLALVSRKRVATLMISNEPLTDDDLGALSRAAERFGFEVLLAPGYEASDALLGSIVSSRSVDGVLEVVRNEPYNYTPPTDEQPYFFNLIRPSRILRAYPITLCYSSTGLI